jgi:hypothetical protein
MGENFSSVIIIITLIAHLPAIIMAIVGLALLREKPSTGKTLLIIAGAYTIVGLGICGALIG